MSPSRELVLGGGRVILADRVLTPGWVAVNGERIEALGSGPPPPSASVVDCDGLWLVPGFVDMHVHGGGGASFASDDMHEIARAAEFQRAHGATSVIASLVSAPLDALEHQLAALASCADAGLIAGVHLEGPWLSPVRCGAHDPRFLRAPDAGEVRKLLEAGRGCIRMVTLAPELPGAREAIRAITAHGAVAAIGHTDADYAQTRAAIEAGARVATHLFNAMRPLHHREPGAVLGVLEDRRVTLEIIADGLHVHDGLLRWLVASAGAERIALITDAISATGAGDGDYALGGQRVVVRHGEARLAVDQSTLAGSTLTMAAAVRHGVAKLGLEVESAARMASQVPARALGLGGAGTLRVGGRADLVLLDDAATLHGTLWRGEWVGEPPRATR